MLLLQFIVIIRLIILLFYYYFERYVIEDGERIGYAIRQGTTEDGEETYVLSKIQSEVEDGITGDQEDEIHSMTSSAYHKNYLRNNITDQESKVGLKLISHRELSSHCNSNDCWIAIDNRVYDVTNFLLAHPGGSSIITSNAGKDVTSQFNSIGHSAKARSMLSSMHVANLLHDGYEQVEIGGDLRPSSLGDLTKPYQIFKVYVRMTDPYPFAIFATIAFYSFIIFRYSNIMRDVVAVNLQVLTFSGGIKFVITKYLSGAVVLLLSVVVVLFITSWLGLLSTAPHYVKSWYGAVNTRMKVHYWIGLKSFSNHIAAVCLLCSLSTELCLLSFPINRHPMSLFRSTLLLTSSIQFITTLLFSTNNYNSRKICFNSLKHWDILGIIRRMMNAADDPQKRCIVFIFIATYLDIYGLMNSMKNEKETIILLISCFIIVTISRIVLFKALNSGHDMMNGDVFTSVTATVSLSCFYGFFTLLLLGWDSRLRMDIVSALSLDGFGVSAFVPWSWFVLLVSSVSLATMLCSQASTALFSSPSFAVHLLYLSLAGSLWYFGPPEGTGIYWTLLLLALCINGQFSNFSFYILSIISIYLSIYRICIMLTM